MIDHTYYINLNKREDRNRHTLEKVIPFFGLKDEQFTRMPAVDTSSALSLSLRSVGCAQSHVNIYRDAKEKNYDYIMVLEDDFQPIVTSSTFDMNLKYLFDNFSGFNVCNLAYNNMQEIIPIEGPISFCSEVQTTSAYIIRTSFVETIIPTILNSIKELKNGAPAQIHAIDQCWKKFQKRENKWFVMQRVGIQAEGYSDIEGRGVNYGA